MAEWTKDSAKELNHIFSRLDTGTAHPSTPDSPARWEPVHRHPFQAHRLPLCSLDIKDSVLDYPTTPVDLSLV